MDQGVERSDPRKTQPRKSSLLYLIPWFDLIGSLVTKPFPASGRADPVMARRSLSPPSVTHSCSTDFPLFPSFCLTSFVIFGPRRYGMVWYHVSIWMLHSAISPRINLLFVFYFIFASSSSFLFRGSAANARSPTRDGKSWIIFGNKVAI